MGCCWRSLVDEDDVLNDRADMSDHGFIDVLTHQPYEVGVVLGVGEEGGRVASLGGSGHGDR